MTRLTLIASLVGALAAASPALAGRLQGPERADCAFCMSGPGTDGPHYVQASMRHRQAPFVFNETSRAYGRFDIEGIRLLQRMP